MYPQHPSYYQQVPMRKKNYLGLISMGCAVASIFIAAPLFIAAALICGIIAIVLGFANHDRKLRTEGIAGVAITAGVLLLLVLL